MDFAKEVKESTGGDGVDLIVNSLSGDFIPKSLEVLSKDGRFIEIGKADIWSEEQVRSFRADIKYEYVDLVEITQSSPEKIISTLKELVKQFEEGKLSALPIH